jgi:hypothetical protein
MMSSAARERMMQEVRRHPDYEALALQHSTPERVCKALLRREADSRSAGLAGWRYAGERPTGNGVVLVTRLGDGVQLELALVREGRFFRYEPAPAGDACEARKRMVR